MPPRIIAPPTVAQQEPLANAPFFAAAEEFVVPELPTAETDLAFLSLSEKTDRMLDMLGLILEKMEIEAIRNRGNGGVGRQKWSWHGAPSGRMSILPPRSPLPEGEAAMVQSGSMMQSLSSGFRRRQAMPRAYRPAELPVIAATGGLAPASPSSVSPLGAAGIVALASENAVPSSALERAMEARARAKQCPVPAPSALRKQTSDDESVPAAVARGDSDDIDGRSSEKATAAVGSSSSGGEGSEAPVRSTRFSVKMTSFVSAEADEDEGRESQRTSRTASTRMSQWLTTSFKSNHTTSTERDRIIFGRRKKVWQFMEDKDSSLGARLYYYLSTALIGTTVVLSVLDLASPLYAGYRYTLGVIQAILALELIVRYGVCPNRHTFWLDVYSVLDLLVLILTGAPLLAIACGDLERELAYSIRVFMPVLLSLRYLRRFDNFHLIVFAFREAALALPVLLYPLLLIALFHAALIYILEPREALPLLNDSIWWTMTTMSTVGYAEAPVTSGGKVAALLLSTITGLYLAIPIGIVGNTFSNIWNDRDRLVLMQQMRRRVARCGYTPYDLIQLFSRLDEDNSQSLTFGEFKEFLPVIQVSMPESLALRIFETIDEDCEGTISFEEFLQAIFPAHHFYMTAMGRGPRRALAKGRRGSG